MRAGKLKEALNDRMLGAEMGVHLEEYYYTWRGRYRGVYYMLWWFLIFMLFMSLTALFRGSELSFNHEIYLYLLIAAVFVGFIGDCVSTAGVLKSYHMIGLGEDGLTVQVARDERVFMPWTSIRKIDDFNILDMQVTDSVSKSPDFWAARGVGGFRVTTEDEKVYRIYRTLNTTKPLGPR